MFVILGSSDADGKLQLLVLTGSAFHLELHQL